MSMSFQSALSRFLATLSLLAFLGLVSAPAAAASPDPRMFGPWVVQQAPVPDNVGLQVYFSPDGNFFMVDPKTKLGMVGSWVVGRSGLLVSIYGNGKWAKLWDADVHFLDNDRMVVDVVESQLTTQQRFTLLRLKF